MKLIQWNIGGARVRHSEANPSDVTSYSTESVGYIADVIRRVDPDVITLQETHEDEYGVSHTGILAESLGFEYWVNDTHDESHIEKGQKFGQAIISRYPITSHIFQPLPNPNLTVVKDGQEAHSHNFGITTAEVLMPSGRVRVQTLHMPALHYYNVTPDMPAGRDVLHSVGESIEVPQYPVIIAGDYNLDTVTVLDLLLSSNHKGLREAPADEFTTPKGKRLDHIVYSGFEAVKLTVKDEALTDHYPVIVELTE